MTIKEVSAKYGISQDALRYYERAGMIPPVNRENGIRNYTDEDLRWVELAKCMRSAGITVEAIVEYVHLFQEGDSTLKERLHLLSVQRESLLEQRRQIDVHSGGFLLRSNAMKMQYGRACCAGKRKTLIIVKQMEIADVETEIEV